jgi:cell division protein FtsB
MSEPLRQEQKRRRQRPSWRLVAFLFLLALGFYAASFLLAGRL